MARRRKANKKAPAQTATTSVAASVESREPVVTPMIVAPVPPVVPLAEPSPPILDTGVVLAPTHKKFGKFRCLLGDAASSSPSSSSDDQTTLVEDWGVAGVVAEEVILTQEMEVSQCEEVVAEEGSMEQPVSQEETSLQEQMEEVKPPPPCEEKNEDIHPSFERLSIIMTPSVTEKTDVVEDDSKSSSMPEVDQPLEQTQDSQGSIDGDSSSNQTPVVEETENKENKGEGTDTDTSSSSNTHSANSSSSVPMTRRRSSRIRNLQETLASSRESPAQAACPPAAPAVATELSPIEEENSTPNPPSPASLLPPQAPPPSSKPVKVKSRWRRSSELEMNVTPTTSSCSSPLLCPSPPSGPSSVQSSPQHTSSSNEMETKPALLPADEERLRSYGHLNENVYLTERERNKETKRMVCDCFLTKEEMAKGELGCGEDCLNRLLMIECGSRCPLGDQCSNKRFQRMEHSPLEIFRTEKKGFGLRATAEVQNGDFLTEYVGEVLDPKEFRRRAKDYAKDKNRHYYFMALKSDAIIDATQKGNHSRFINHSCDPNAETQKWTVNGELRIGFFATKNIAVGEEVTFDYQFQRYGKEAQRCYCESANCRGWIGEDPDKEEKEEKDEKPRSQARKGDRKDKRKDRGKQQSSGRDVKDLLEDMDLEQEVEKLCSSGLKNQAHTLTLCRLMVRVEDRESRGRLLQLLRTAEPACRRLFLDYHGLRLIWSWMIDTDTSFRSEIMETLGQLPIPNKTMLQDSKVLAVIERWALDAPVRSPDESSTSTGDSSAPKVEAVPAVKKEGETPMEGVEEVKPKEQETAEEGDESNEDSKSALERRAEDSEMARKLLESWAGLKEVFRIPKKERIEQMKEHEREADRGYKEYLESGSKPRVDRYRSGLGTSAGIGVLSGSNAIAIGVNKRMRESRDSPDVANRKAQRMEERDRHLSRLSKYERRQLFELRVEKEDRERRELWQQQQQQQQQQQMAHAAAPYMLDANGVPCYWEPATGSWHQISQFPHGHMPEQNGPLPHPPPHGPHMLPHPGLDLNYTQTRPHQFDPNRGEYPPNPHVMYEGGPHPPPQWEQPVPIIQPQSVNIPPIPIPPLPPKWKAVYDNKGQPYYYHIKLRVPQWEPPPFPLPEPPPPAQEASTSSESSEESEEEEEDEEEEVDEEEETPSSDEEPVPEKVEEEPEPEDESEKSEESEEGAKVEPPSKSEKPPEPPEESTMEVPKEDVDMESDVAAKDTSVTTETPQATPVKEPRRREGLVTEIIISPRREEEEPPVNSNKKYKEIKERLRRQKEKEARKQRGQSSGKSSSKSSSKSGRERRRDKTKGAPNGGESSFVDPDSDAGRRIKEQFRLKMAGVMVQCLNAYRKPDCKAGRICSTEDFKHLARKLTHFVMLKELKHCRNVVDLVCNDNVKHKARDFVKKYMAKFGETYQREVEN